MRFSSLCLLVVFLTQSAEALAEEKQNQAALSIRVIYAVKDGELTIDPDLEDIRDELKELPATRFRLLDRLQTTVELESAVELQLPGNNLISVKFLGIDSSGTKPMLSLELALKPALKIQLRLASGGRTLIGGPQHLEGKLVLDVSARLEEKKP
jgi:hypothetical protein